MKLSLTKFQLLTPSIKLRSFFFHLSLMAELGKLQFPFQLLTAICYLCFSIFVFNAWFTFSSRQNETRWEQEREGYIPLVFHTLDLFSSRLEALGDMLVNQSLVKGNENVLNVLPCYRRFSYKSVNIYIRVYFVSFTSYQKYRRVLEMRM